MDKKNSIQGKKILFLAPAFFGYEIKIKHKMEEMGAKVDFYDVRSVSSAFERALLKLSPKIFKRKTKKYYSNIIETTKEKQYDYIFVVKGDMITKEVVSDFRKMHPNAKLCLYLWDSVKNIPGITNKFTIFDRVLSFDRQDVEKYGILKFRPLFYSDEFKKELLHNSKKDYKYDICFCGTIHSDRYAIIEEVIGICNHYNLRIYNFMYLQSKFIYKFYKLTKKEFRKTQERDFSYIKKNGKEISNIVGNSRIVLDIQHPKQTGLTMRTIEMIGMNKKLITTNEDIKNYDFYNPDNILVIQRNEIEISKEFMKSSYKPLDSKIYDKYSIKSWINDILFEIE